MDVNDLKGLNAEVKRRMDGAIEHVRKELAGVRTGRASVNLLDPVQVEAYGTTMPLNQVASLSIPEPTLIVAQPFDPTLMSAVERGIQKANLGLNPVVEWFMRRGMRRSYAVLAVISMVVLAVIVFLSAIVPVITEQVTTLTDNAPDYLDELMRNRQIQTWNDDYQIIDKVKDYIATGDFGQKAFGGVLGFGMAVLSALLNTFVIVVLTLYFLASLPLL